MDVMATASILQWGSMGMGKGRLTENDSESGTEQQNYIFQTLLNPRTWASESPLVLIH